MESTQGVTTWQNDVRREIVNGLRAVAAGKVATMPQLADLESVADALVPVVERLIAARTADLCHEVADLRRRHAVAKSEADLMARELDRARRERQEAVEEAADWQEAYRRVFDGAAIAARKMRRAA